jgi:CBS domain containing-hemolysin-like protein
MTGLKVLSKIKTYLGGLFAFRDASDGSLRDTIEELIEEGPQGEDSLNLQEKALLTNVLRLQDLTADRCNDPTSRYCCLGNQYTCARNY